MGTPSLGIPAPPDHERVQVEGPVRQPDDLLELEVGLDGLGRVRVRVGVRVRVRVRVRVEARLEVRVEVAAAGSSEAPSWCTWLGLGSG